MLDPNNVGAAKAYLTTFNAMFPKNKTTLSEMVNQALANYLKENSKVKTGGKTASDTIIPKKK